MSSYEQVQATYFDWEIVNFSKHCKCVGDSISSPVFAAHQTRWIVKLFVDGFENGEKFVSIFLKSLGGNEIQVSFEVSLLNCVGQVFHEATSPKVLFSHLSSGWGWEWFCRRGSITNSRRVPLVLNRLIVRCKLDLNTVSETSIRDHLASNMGSLFLNPQFSDLIITVGRYELFAHKNILAARSKVFSAMFSCNMRENRENNLRITDISCDVMKELLRFIYCGKVLNIETIVEPLIIAADKYDIHTLKTLCEQTIWRFMDVPKACHILHLADSHDCKALRFQTFTFVMKNIANMIKTSGFKKLKYVNPNLREEIFCKMNVKNLKH